MKEFFKTLKYALFGEILIWALFITLKEKVSINSNLILPLGIIILILMIMIYIILSPRMIKREKIDKIKFHVCFMISWVVLTILAVFGILNFEKTGIIKECIDICVLQGDEYLFFALGMISQALITPVLICLAIFFKPHKKNSDLY